MNKREESRCSKFTLQPAVRKTYFTYLFIFAEHKGDLLEVFGKKKYEAYVQSVLFVINKVTEAEKTIMSCHRIWIPTCFLLHVFRQKIIMESWSWEARSGYDSWVGFVLNLPGSIWPTACWVSGTGKSLLYGQDKWQSWRCNFLVIQVGKPLWWGTADFAFRCSVTPACLSGKTANFFPLQLFSIVNQRFKCSQL